MLFLVSALMVPVGAFGATFIDLDLMGSGSMQTSIGAPEISDALSERSSAGIKRNPGLLEILPTAIETILGWLHDFKARL